LSVRVLTIALLVALAIGCSHGSPTSPTNRDLPNYQGHWTGAYRVDRCSWFPDNPFYQYICTGYTAGTVNDLSMTFSQNGDVVTGQFIAGGLVSSAFVSALNAQGGLEIRATNSAFPYQYDFTWRLSVAEQRRITGNVLIVRTGNSGLVGGANVEGTVVSLTR
jgi:hypothetical protein